MENAKRIPIILKIFQNNNIKKRYIKYLFPGLTSSDIREINNAWFGVIEKIEEYWKKNPNLRLTQVLIEIGVLPNISGFWFYTQEEEYLIKHESIKSREILFWNQKYDKDKNILPKSKYVLIKDLSTEHLKNIINDAKKGSISIREIYFKALIDELKLKKNDYESKKK